MKFKYTMCAWYFGCWFRVFKKWFSENVRVLDWSMNTFKIVFKYLTILAIITWNAIFFCFLRCDITWITSFDWMYDKVWFKAGIVMSYVWNTFDWHTTQIRENLLTQLIASEVSITSGLKNSNESNTKQLKLISDH